MDERFLVNRSEDFPGLNWGPMSREHTKRGAPLASAAGTASDVAEPADKSGAIGQNTAKTGDSTM